MVQKLQNWYDVQMIKCISTVHTFSYYNNHSMTIEREYFSFFGSGLLPLICNDSVEGAMSQSFYVLNAYTLH